MSEKIGIIRASAAHLDALASLFDGYRRFYAQASDIEAGRVFLADRMEHGESVIFLARVGAAAAGMAQLYPTFSSVSLVRRWILNDLFVDPAFRGHGVGRALTRRCMEHCRESGAGAMMLLTESTNAPARRLYESLGWERDEKYWRYTWKTPAPAPGLGQ